MTDMYIKNMCIYIYVHTHKIRCDAAVASSRIGSLAQRLRQDKSETASKAPRNGIPWEALSSSKGLSVGP